MKEQEYRALIEVLTRGEREWESSFVSFHASEEIKKQFPFPHSSLRPYDDGTRINNQEQKRVDDLWSKYLDGKVSKEDTYHIYRYLQEIIRTANSHIDHLKAEEKLENKEFPSLNYMLRGNPYSKSGTSFPLRADQIESITLKIKGEDKEVFFKSSIITLMLGMVFVSLSHHARRRRSAKEDDSGQYQSYPKSRGRYASLRSGTGRY